MTKPKNDSPDTVTPPADDAPTENPAPLNDGTAGRPNTDEYKTTGQTVVATHVGYAYNDSTGKFPTITSSGLNVSADDATALVDESKGRVYIVTDKKED